MAKSENKALIIVNENNIFYKIKSFIKKIFSKEKTIVNTANLESIHNNKNDNFIKSLRNDEELKLLDIQHKIKLGTLKIKDIDEEIKLKLINLYEKQNKEKKFKLNNIKNKILVIRKKLQANS